MSRFCDYSNVHSRAVANKMKYSKNSIKMKDVNQQMNDYYNAVMKLNGVSNEDGISKGIKPTDLTMRDINAGVTIPYYGEREGGNSLTTMCMSCDTGIATTRLHKNCHVEHEDLELTVAAYQTLVDKKGEWFECITISIMSL